MPAQKKLSEKSIHCVLQTQAKPVQETQRYYSGNIFFKHHLDFYK